LELIGSRAKGRAEWHYPLLDARRRAFAGYLPGALSEADSRRFLRTVMDGMDILGWDRPSNTMGPIARGTKWMVSAGCRCPYRYGSMTVSPVEFPPWMQDLLQVCMPLCGLSTADSWPNSCNLNCYADGTDGVDWHADDEPIFGGRDGDCRIISLSLGETRSFELRLKDEDDAAHAVDGACACRLRLQSGDICTMEGLMQKHYVHRVPKAGGRDTRLRVNLTWRWISSHEQHRCGL